MEETEQTTQQLQQEQETLRQQIAALRMEKRQQELLENARQTLTGRGLSTGFAVFLVGEDERGTARNIAEFERQFTAALETEVARRLPQQTPEDFAAVPVPRQRRGIRRV